MKSASVLILTLTLSGCSLLQPKKQEPKPRFAHSYLSLPQTQEEIKNLNPDSSGNPWIAGGLILPTEEEIRAVPKLHMPHALRSVMAAPSLVDNSTKKYFRGIFSQRHGSCAQASAIAYVFGYEVNRMRNADASDVTNRFPTHWTYNFVNHGYDRGSWMMWGWEVGKSMGIPNAKAYGTETGYDLRHWPSDYEVYENAMDSRVDRYFIMGISSETRVAMMKAYLWNHGKEGSDGGLVSIAAGWSTGYAEAVIPQGQYGAGKKLIRSFGKSVNHAVTFVGYDDQICFDFNEDGECTNDKDLNGDEVVNLKDWEIGAYIMANSWGTRWGNDGFIYVPYRLGAVNPSDGGIYKRSAYGMYPKPDEERKLALRVRMQHNKRNDLRFLSSYFKDNVPRYDAYYGLQLSGGSHPLNGNDMTPVTFGFDLRNLLFREDLEDALDISAVVDALGRGAGEIEKVEVVDYLNNLVVEAEEHDVKVDKGRNTVDVTWDPTPGPKPCQVGPIALAGRDTIVGEYCTLILDGSMSFDRDGKIVRYQWEQTAGPHQLPIENANSPRAMVLIPTVDADEVYAFEITVMDNHGYSASDTAKVTVKNRFEQSR